MDQLKPILTLCKKCSTPWIVTKLGVDDFHVRGTKIVSAITPQEPTPLDYAEATMTGEVETHWAASQMFPAFREVGPTAICPECGGDLMETFVWVVPPPNGRQD